MLTKKMLDNLFSSLESGIERDGTTVKFDGVRSLDGLKEWHRSLGFDIELDINGETVNLNDLKMTERGIRLTIEQDEDLPEDTVEINAAEEDSSESEAEEDNSEAEEEVEVTEEAAEDEASDSNEEAEDSNESDEDEEEVSRSIHDLGDSTMNRSDFNKTNNGQLMLPYGGMKAYERRIANGSATFDSAERAEAAGAWARQMIARKANINYNQSDTDLKILERAGVGVLNEGGALRHDEFVPELIDLISRYGVARRVLNVYESNSDLMRFPRVLSQAAATWLTENTAPTDANLDVDNVEVVARPLGLNLPVSMQLMNASAIDVADMIFDQIANQIAKAEDQALILGDGTSTYGGIVGLINSLGAGGKVTDANSTYATITEASMHSLFGKVNASVDRSRAKILCSPTVFQEVLVRLVADKGGIQMVDFQNQRPGLFYLGTEIILTDLMQSTFSNASPFILYGDFNQAAKMFYVAGSTNFSASSEAGFTKNQMYFKGYEEVGIKVHDSADATNTGPYSGLLGT